MNIAVHPSELWRSRIDLPSYEVGDAAKYARVHPNTVARWHRDTTLPHREARTKLSYLQLIEMAVVAACRQAGMKLADIRTARAFYAGAFQTKHPFATLRLKTDGIDLAMDAGADLLIGNKAGQLAWKSFIGQRFREFDYEDGIAARWRIGGKTKVIIDPQIQFGAPSIDGVPTWALKGRWTAGESLKDIADDFGLKSNQVAQALAFEGIEAAKAKRPEWNH